MLIFLTFSLSFERKSGLQKKKEADFTVKENFRDSFILRSRVVKNRPQKGWFSSIWTHQNSSLTEKNEKLQRKKILGV